MDYLSQLMKEKNILATFPGMFVHSERLIDIEIARVRAHTFQLSAQNNLQAVPNSMPMEERVTLRVKVWIPVKEHPNFNFVGRILGPRGMTIRQLEQETGCRIMIRGKGSFRDRDWQKDAHRSKPNWEHLEEELHVLVECEDTKDRARVNIANAVSRVEKLLIPVQGPDAIDDLKRRQLTELAIINGTYRPKKQPNIGQMLPRLMPPSLSTPVKPSSSSSQSQFFPPSSINTDLDHDSPLPSPLKKMPPVSTGANTPPKSSFSVNSLIEQLTDLDHIPEKSPYFQSRYFQSNYQASEDIKHSTARMASSVPNYKDLFFARTSTG